VVDNVSFIAPFQLSPFGFGRVRTSFFGSAGSIWFLPGLMTSSLVIKTPYYNTDPVKLGFFESQ